MTSEAPNSPNRVEAQPPERSLEAPTDQQVDDAFNLATEGLHDAVSGAVDSVENLDSNRDSSNEEPPAPETDSNAPGTPERSRESVDIEGTLNGMFEELVELLGPLLGELIEKLETLLASAKESLSELTSESREERSRLEDTIRLMHLPEEQRVEVLRIARTVNTNNGIKSTDDVREAPIINLETLSNFTNALRAQGVTVYVGKIELPRNLEGVRGNTFNGITFINVAEIDFSDIESDNSSLVNMLRSMYVEYNNNFNNPTICIGSSPEAQTINMMLYAARNPRRTVDQIIADFGYREMVNQNDGDINIKRNLQKILDNNSGIRTRITGATETAEVDREDGDEEEPDAEGDETVAAAPTEETPTQAEADEES